MLAIAIGIGIAAAIAATTAARASTGPLAPSGFGRIAPPLPALALDVPLLLARVTGGHPKGSPHGPLDAERARLMLQSLTVPGWGQARSGHPTAAKTFLLIDAAIWTSLVAFEVQDHLRIESSIHTAQLFAGIDLHGRSDQYRRVVGSFASSEEYNRLVVYRDAANLYYNDPDNYRAYIAAHSIGGSDAWAWTDQASFERYRGQRKNAERAAQRANTALTLALANRLVSAIHVAGVGRGAPHRDHALRLEFAPDPERGPDAVRCGLSARF